MSRLQITKIYKYGFIMPRVTERYGKNINCNGCARAFKRGLGSITADNDDAMCVGAIANGWKLYDTSTFCDECRKYTLFWVCRAAGWLFNFFPPPIPVLLALSLAVGASLATHKVYTSYEPIPEAIVREEQTS